MRQLVDERYTASALLGLNQAVDDESGGTIILQTSANLCSVPYTEVLADYKWAAEEPQNGELSNSIKRVRRRGKYTPQERERIRLITIIID